MTLVAVARRVRRVPLVCAALFALAACLSPAAALAFGAVGADPSSNITPGDYPSACWQDPTGATCEAAAVASLQHSRSAMGQPAYALPADFGSLSGAQQALILTNLDRAQYGLPPVVGLVASFTSDAAAGVVGDADPSPSTGGWTGWTANWAGGMPNMPAAYQMWMYDDGAGSGNLDCSSAGDRGCWGHRHDTLWQFDGTGPLVMGAAVGTDRQGSSGFAMLLVSERSSVSPSYTYTWSQAVADGAGSSSAPAPAPPSVPATTTPPSPPIGAVTATVRARITRLTVAGRRVTVSVAGPSGAKVSVALSVVWRGRYVRDRFSRCSTRFAYVKVPKGRYRLRVRIGSATLTRYLVVR